MSIYVKYAVNSNSFFSKYYDVSSQILQIMKIIIVIQKSM